jgi:hypothetical protein
MNVIHAGQRFQNAFAFDFNLLRGFEIRRGQLHRHADRAVGGGNFFDEAERNDVARKAGIFHGGQCVFYVILREHWVHKLPATRAKASLLRSRVP